MIYRHKPVEVEALQYTGDNFEEMQRFMKVHAVKLTDGTFCITEATKIIQVFINDFVVRDIQGNYYPVSPDLFNELYEVIE